MKMKKQARRFSNLNIKISVSEKLEEINFTVKN